MGEVDSPTELDAAMAQLRAGKLVAYPTETVWGIAADARSPRAVEALQQWKGRASTQPISILISKPAVLDMLGFERSELGARLMARFWPGPLTLVLPCLGVFAPGIARADGAVGVRCSSHPVARALAQRAEAEGIFPLTSTSLNRSGEPSVTARDDAERICAQSEGVLMLGLELDWEGECDTCGSTVLDLAGPSPRVLRWGALGRADLDPILGGDALGGV